MCLSENVMKGGEGGGEGALMSNPTLGLPECTNNNSVERERNAAGA